MQLIPPRHIAVICPHRIGDVLLATPLIRSLKSAWPQARIDAVTLDTSAVALEGNPDIDRIIDMPYRASLKDSLRAVAAPRHHDLAVATLPTDRTHLLAWWCSRNRAGLIPAQGPGHRWKRWNCRWAAEAGARAGHTVDDYLQIADALGIPRCPVVVPPRSALAPPAALPSMAAPYAIIHPSPLFAYKQWTAAGWVALARHLLKRGLAVYLTGGPTAEDKARAEAVVDATDPVRVHTLAGQLSFAELTPLIEHARIYVGPDTSVTHLAAATGTPTVALFGPIDPRVWGPWPLRWNGPAPSPWVTRMPLQHTGNVWIVQGIEPCVPCNQEGCDHRPDSLSRCLTSLPAVRVIRAVDAALGSTEHTTTAHDGENP